MNEPSWLTIARGEIGVSEVDGDIDNLRIIQYLRTCRIPDGIATHDEVPWCSAALNFCFAAAGYEGTRSLLARSWLDYGRPISKPRLGCVTVLARGLSWQGHVGLWLGEDEGCVNLLSGNNKNGFNNDWFVKSRVLGYRWPMVIDVVMAGQRRVVWRGGDYDSFKYLEGREAAVTCYSRFVQKVNKG